MVQLPSGRLLQYHKNVVNQAPGINESVIKWTVEEAKSSKRRSIDTAGKVGGLILDEMAIQVPHIHFSFKCQLYKPNKLFQIHIYTKYLIVRSRQNKKR